MKALFTARGSFLGALCASLLLAACGGAPTVHLSGGPINGGGTLDPTDPANIKAYFYLDRPVEGLMYSCDIPARLPVSGNTDEDGAFVCPRTSTVSFFVGDFLAGYVKIGSVSLEIYGHADDSDARNYVAITPATLYGTTTTTYFGTGAQNNNTNYEIPNIFNLITSLDSPHAGRQARIVISENVAKLIGPALSTLDLHQPVVSFIQSLEPAIGAIDPGNTTYYPKNPNGTEPLVNGGYMLQPSVLAALVDVSLRRARTGLYRASPQFSVTNGNTSLLGSLTFLLGAEGDFAGFGESRKTVSTSSGSSTDLEVFYLDPTSTVEADGDLIGGVSGGTTYGLRTENGVAGSMRTFDFFGRLINDRVYGNYTYLNNGSVYTIPQYYRDNQLSTSHVGGFNTSETGLSSVDGLWVSRVAEQLPDIDLDLLPPEPYHFPRTYLMTFKGYPDGALTTDTQRADPNYPVALPDHQNPDDEPAPEPDGFLQFTILPNGDIVSDVDGDCSDVVNIGGNYVDGGGAGHAEYLVGKVGNLFQAEGPPTTVGGSNVTHTYATLLLAVYDRRHPQMGFTVGFTPITGSLDPVVLDTTADALNDPGATLLLNKRCKPLETCDRYLEWFNDQRFMDEFLKPAFAAGNDTATVHALYLNPDYYGRITGLVRVCTGP